VRGENFSVKENAFTGGVVVTFHRYDSKENSAYDTCGKVRYTLYLGAVAFELDNEGVFRQFLAGSRDLHFHLSVQIDSVPNPASY
jgi:hypothetical protein